MCIFPGFHKLKCALITAEYLSSSLPPLLPLPLPTQPLMFPFVWVIIWLFILPMSSPLASVSTLSVCCFLCPSSLGLPSVHIFTIILHFKMESYCYLYVMCVSINFSCTISTFRSCWCPGFGFCSFVCLFILHRNLICTICNLFVSPQWTGLVLETHHRLYHPVRDLFRLKIANYVHVYVHIGPEELAIHMHQQMLPQA